jgi:hypothetical protein
MEDSNSDTEADTIDDEGGSEEGDEEEPLSIEQLEIDDELWRNLPKFKIDEPTTSALFLITSFTSEMHNTEPYIKGLEKGVKIAGQRERSTPSTLEPHWHLAISVPRHIVKSKRGSQSVLAHLFPKSALVHKDVRVGAKGSRFNTMAQYCIKSWANDGDPPLLIGWAPPAPGETRKRSSSEMEELIRKCPSVKVLRAIGETRGSVRKDYCNAMEVHSTRTPVYPALADGHVFCAWECVIFEMLRRPPHPTNDVIHWLVPSNGQWFSTMDRFAIQLRRVLTAQKRSTEMAFVNSDAPVASITSALKHETKLVVVMQHERAPCGHAELHRLGYMRQTQFWQKGSHNWVELQPRRHVIVLSSTPPRGAGSACAKTWTVCSSPSKAKWEHRAEMLDSVGDPEDYDFLDLKLLGISGSTVREVDEADLCES